MTPNERDDKWFLEFPSEMIECGSVVIVIVLVRVIVNMCGTCVCEDSSI